MTVMSFVVVNAKPRKNQSISQLVFLMKLNPSGNM